jgi:hypothetical protein
MTAHSEFDTARQALSVAHQSNSSLCDPFLAALPVAGASVSVLAARAGQSTMCSSSAIAARLDELQFDLGEGPCWEALATRRPVLTPDIRSGSHASWPVFAEAVRSDRTSRDVSGLFAFPLTVGSLDIGAVDLYTESPRVLTRSEVADASALASVAAWQVLRRILNDEESDVADPSPISRTSRREVHQATGMVLAQLGVGPDEAALLIRAYSFSSGRPVREVAADIVDRRLDFSALTPTWQSDPPKEG